MIEYAAMIGNGTTRIFNATTKRVFDEASAFSRRTGCKHFSTRMDPAGHTVFTPLNPPPPARSAPRRPTALPSSADRARRLEQLERELAPAASRHRRLLRAETEVYEALRVRYGDPILRPARRG